MNKVRIDFAPPRLRRTVQRAPRLTWALLWASLCMVPGLVQNGAGYRRQEAEQAHLEAAAQAARSAAAPAPAPVRAPVPEAQASAVDAAVLQLNLPWRALHDVVQSATPPGIALLALEPDAKKSRLRITAEAKNSDDMIAYVEQLERQQGVRTVSLVRHEIDEQDPNRPIRFQLDAEWKAAP